MPVEEFNDEQLRAIANLEQIYDAWMEGEKRLAALPYGMKWHQAGGGEFLYQVLNRQGNSKSLGKRNPQTEAIYANYQEEKSTWKERTRLSKTTLEQAARIYRALRLPAVSSDAARILQEADRKGVLGRLAMAVGTNAMPAYAIEAGGFIRDAPDETMDFDMAWSAASEPDDPSPLWTVLKGVDPTYKINTERPFQARNAKAYEVEIVAAPSRIGTMGRLDRPKPAPLPEQEWLLMGRPISHVVIGRDHTPARLVVPDPRYFALQKLWMSAQEKRNVTKRTKDRKQGLALLDAIRDRMPHFPMDDAFVQGLPTEIGDQFEAWQAALR